MLQRHFLNVLNVPAGLWLMSGRIIKWKDVKGNSHGLFEVGTSGALRRNKLSKFNQDGRS
jgi:hypothetical protein